MLIERTTKGNVTEFAKTHGYSRSQIYQFLSTTYNDGRSMGERAARELEKRANLSQGWLDQLPKSFHSLVASQLENPNQMRFDKELGGELGIKIIGEITVDLEGYVFVDADQQPGAPDRYIEIHFQDRNLFALRLKGMTQMPRVKSGEYLIVDRDAIPRNGDDVIVKFITGETYFVQFLYERGGDLFFGTVINPSPSLSMPRSTVLTLERVIMILDDVEGSVIET
jgi:SOS-response transcriptional repressor LexA